MAETLMDWLFSRLAAEFGTAWTDVYNPKRTRVVKAAKAEWARWLSGFDKAVLDEAVTVARRQGSVPPSASALWGMAKAVQARRRSAERGKRSPDVGRQGISAVRAALGMGTRS